MCFITATAEQSAYIRSYLIFQGATDPQSTMRINARHYYDDTAAGGRAGCFKLEGRACGKDGHRSRFRAETTNWWTKIPRTLMMSVISIATHSVRWKMDQNMPR
jgi:hypothetical protein